MDVLPADPSAAARFFAWVEDNEFKVWLWIILVVLILVAPVQTLAFGMMFGFVWAMYRLIFRVGVYTEGDYHDRF